MKRVFRDYQHICRAEGVTLLRIDHDSRHCRLQFEAGFVVAAVSPSDHRNLKQVRSAIRRLHR